MKALFKLFHAVLNRLAYLGLMRRGGAWRWFVDSLDYAVRDHIQPWTKLIRRDGSMVHPTVSFRSAQNVHLGSHTRIQPHCVLWASPNSSITIGDSTGLGPGTMIFSSNHQFALGEPYHRQPWNEASVSIGRDVWVGAGCVILPGVTVGDCCVIAAGSIVTKDIPPNSLAAGVPARVLRARDADALPGEVDVDA